MDNNTPNIAKALFELCEFVCWLFGDEVKPHVKPTHIELSSSTSNYITRTTTTPMSEHHVQVDRLHED